MNVFTYRRDGAALADALRAFQADAVALVYAPRWCGFARLVGGQLIGFARPIPADAYEVRAFDHTAELRWLKDPASAGGTGAAAILIEDAAWKVAQGWTQIPRNPEQPVIATSAVTYLLWGKHTAAPNPQSVGWSLLALARIGALPVPLSGLASGQRVLLNAVEYIAEDEYGSAFVCEERLTGLKVLTENGNG